MTDRDTAGTRDFDFLIGRWKVRNRRLKERLKGSNAWEEFDATLEVRSILEGVTLRLDAAPPSLRQPAPHRALHRLDALEA